MAQFVPIKLDVASPEFREWNQAHPSEGNGIPKVYLVRSNGETLYAKTGLLSVDQLGQLLTAALASNGRVLDEREATFLLELAAEIRQHREAEEWGLATAALRRLRKFGKPEALQSFASPVIGLQEELAALAEVGNSKLEEVRNRLTAESDEATRIAAVSDYLQVREQFRELPPLQDGLSDVGRQISRDPELREAQRLLRSIQSSLAAGSPRQIAKAIEKLESLLSSHPDGEWNRRIMEALTELRKRAAESDGEDHPRSP